MKRRILALAAAPLMLAGCEGIDGFGGPGGPYVQLSEAVIALAAPYQDLNAVRINESDGCYEYRHVGPVETTYLPLRSKDGRPICTRAPEDAAAAG